MVDRAYLLTHESFLRIPVSKNKRVKIVCPSYVVSTSFGTMSYPRCDGTSLMFRDVHRWCEMYRLNPSDPLVQIQVVYTYNRLYTAISLLCGLPLFPVAVHDVLHAVQMLGVLRVYLLVRSK